VDDGRTVAILLDLPFSKAEAMLFRNPFTLTKA